MQEHKNIKISKSDEIGLRKINLSDTRLIEKGIVCSTKNKHELLKIAANLGISISKMNKSDIRIKKLCNLIRGALMRMEIKERKKDSRYKFLYSWWDEMITFEYI
jgi:predicted transcriptional regulator